MACESILRRDNQLIILLMAAVLVIIGNGPDGVPRLKGFVSLEGQDIPVLVQRMGRWLRLSPARGEAAIAALVLIGGSDVFAPAHRRP